MISPITEGMDSIASNLFFSKTAALIAKVSTLLTLVLSSLALYQAEDKLMKPLTENYI